MLHKSRFRDSSTTLTDYSVQGFRARCLTPKCACATATNSLPSANDLRTAWRVCSDWRQAYSKYSLGTYTLLKEAEYGKRTGRRWFYPGYILDKRSDDYKLKLGPWALHREQTVGEARELQT